ncbi:MAG: trypsin-like serine protease [Nannocystaceae bacterium]
MFSVAPAILILSAGLVADRGSGPAERIYGGTPVSDGDFLAVIGIHVEFGERAILCTGTVVAPQVAITAAHCFAQLDNDTPVRVYVGEKLVDPKNTVLAESWGIHPDYNPERKEDTFDYAYIRLAEPLDVGTIAPIGDQAVFDATIGTGSAVTIVGYGETESGELGVKHEVTTSITSFTSSGAEFFAGGEGKDSCIGDSGGPALVKHKGEWHLGGLLSRGYDCGEGGVYGVPFAMLCWLRDETGADLLPSSCNECQCLDVSPPGPDDSAKEGCWGGSENRGALFVLPGCLWLTRRRRRST